MEFGRLSVKELDQLDFTLPPEPGRNNLVLPGHPAHGKVYLGMPQWGIKEWVGKVYPAKTKQADFLSHYLNRFNCVELNATHYNLYGYAKLESWALQAKGKDFKFCPKVFNGISHDGNLSNKRELLDQYLENIKGFGEQLGPVWIQLHENFGDSRKRDLFQFLEMLLVNDQQFFIELRHPDLLRNEALFDYLQQKNIGVIITDTAGRRDCAHMKLTVKKTFIRCIFNDHPSDYKRIDEWAQRITYWLNNGMEEIYFIVHLKNEETILDTVNYAITAFNTTAGLSIPSL